MTYGNNWDEYYQGYAQNGTDPKQLEEWFRRLYQSGGISGDLLAEKSIVGYLHIRDASITAATIRDAAITTAHIQDASITTAKILDAAITTAKIEDAAITSAKIANAAIESAHISEAAIQSAHIMYGAIQSAHIAEASIDRTKIMDGEIVSAKIADAAITSAKIADAAITTAKIALGAITTALIAEGAIGEAQIGDASITDAKIVELSASKLTAGTINTGQVTIEGPNGFLRILDNRIQVFDNSQPRIERVAMGDVNNDGSVYGFRVRGADGKTVLYDENGVYNEGITDGAITNPKIADGAVENRHITANTITGDKLVAGTITAREIKARSITANELATNTITAQSGVIADAAITTAKIADAAITNAKISSLDASKITSGYISANRIASGSITAEKMVIGDFTNLCVNPDFLGGKLDKWSGGVIAAIDSEAAEVPAGAPTAYVGKQTNRDGYCGDPFPVKPGDKFYVEFSAATANSTYPFTVGLQFFDANGATISWIRSNYLDPTSDWKTQSGTVTAPSGAVTARVWSQIGGPAGSTGTWYFSRVIVRRMVAGELIVDGSITADKISAKSITADKLNITSLDAISANLGTVTAGTLMGVTVRSDDGKGNSVTVENGSVISKINNRDMVKIKNYNIYFYDSGKDDPTPDYSEAGLIGSTWSLSDPEFRGLSVIGSKDYVSIARSVSETEHTLWARFDFKNRLTEIYGGDDTTDTGKLYLYSTFKGGTANGKVPAIEIENFKDSNGTPWSGVFVFTGRDNGVPANDNFRSGFEVWQYRGTLNGAEKQMLKIDTGSNGATYTGIYTDEAWLPWQTFIKAKNGLYYYPCLITISPDIINIHGDYSGPVTVYVSTTTINIKASENYTYKRMSFNWTENIFFAIAQPYGSYAVYTNARVYNQSSTGFDLYLAWNSDAARTDRTIEVRFLVLLERPSA